MSVHISSSNFPLLYIPISGAQISSVSAAFSLSFCLAYSQSSLYIMEFIGKLNNQYQSSIIVMEHLKIFSLKFFFESYLILPSLVTPSTRSTSPKFLTKIAGIWSIFDDYHASVRQLFLVSMPKLASI